MYARVRVYLSDIYIYIYLSDIDKDIYIYIEVKYIYICLYLVNSYIYIYTGSKRVTPSAKDGQSDNLFVNIGTSRDRLEFASETTPCVSPGHRIWSTKMQRTLLPVEHLCAQGVWRCDAEVPEAFDHLLSDQSLARDMAGNGMTSTVVQAVCLAAFVCSDVWAKVSERTVSSTGQQANPTMPPACEDLEEPSELVSAMHPEGQETNEDDKEVPRERGIKRKMPEKPDGIIADMNANTPKFRCRKKKPGIMKRMMQPPGPDKTRSSGNRSARGKKKMVTILEKDSLQCLADSCFFEVLIYIFIIFIYTYVMCLYIFFYIHTYGYLYIYNNGSHHSSSSPGKNLP